MPTETKKNKTPPRSKRKRRLVKYKYKFRTIYGNTIKVVLAYVKKYPILEKTISNDRINLILMHYEKALMLFRKYKDKTQQDIAQKMKTTQQYVSELEKQEYINSEKLSRVLCVLNSNMEEWEKFKKLLQIE